MFYLVILTVGIVGFRFLPVDLLPAIEFPQLSIRTTYGNVGPEEMERLVTQPIENAVAGVPNVSRVTSNSGTGGSWVSMEFARGTDLAEAANDVRDALERVRNSLPVEADAPRLWKFDPDDIAIVTIAATSTRDLESLTRILERDIIRRFEQIEGVGTIELRGAIRREIRVDIKRDRMRAAGITASDVQQAIGRESTVAPGGNVKDGLRDLYVRTLGEYESVQQVAEAVITHRNGTPIRVQDVAEVQSGFQDVGRLIEVDGVPVVQFQVRKQSGANTVAVADAIRAEAARVNLERSDVQLRVISDQSTFIRQSIDAVSNAAIWGALLAILVLYFFLRNGSSTGIIALSIPISIIASFGLLYFADLSLNQMTFGGLALGIGLIVDNAIVVLDNIVRKREENSEELKEAASNGTREVVGAIVASTLTTSVIFLPIVFMQTVTATLFQELALVVVFALVCSLLVALTLVPMLASRFLTVKKGAPDPKARGSRFRERFRRFEDWYTGRLSFALGKRLWVMGAAALLILGAVFLGRYVPIELAPDTDANEVRVNLRMDDGTNVAVVQSYLEELEALVLSVVPLDDVDNITTEIWRGRGQIAITLPDKDRRVDSGKLAEDIREAVTGVVPGARISVRAQPGLWIFRRLFSSGGGDGGDALQLQLRGYEIEESRMWARRIADRVEALPGIRDVNVGGEDDAGPPEQRILLDRERIAALGLSIQEVARAVQLGIGGGRAGAFREGGDEYPIMVRLRPEDRLTTIDLENIAVRTPSGETIPISAVTEQERARGVSGIRRINGQRVTFITADLEPGVALGDAVQRVRAEIATIDLPEEYAVVFGGEYEEQQRAQRDFMIAVLLALALIYMVMAGQFERFIDPLIVMFSVPLAIVGVVPMLWLTGTTFNFQSMMGLIMLIGIVVNNAIVLVDYINLMRRERGMEVMEAVVEAGRLRLRPILMTTVTTILGLIPLAIGLGAGSEIQAALARTVIGGLTAATLITLVLIPVVYVSVYRVKAAAYSMVTNLRGTGPVAGPASS
jgi:hydrophobic/amphiphilic exporter-1 (mainly G- bacteria), HAE1 family